MTRIPAWKFEAVRAAILASLVEQDVPFSELNDAVRGYLDENDYHRLGSLGWHVTTVKLEMEVRGEIERLPGNGPQVIRRVT